MAADIDTGMDKTDMRRKLIAAGKDGANCAFGDAGSGYALLRLDAHKASTALAKGLKDDFRGSKVYQGVAAVDENDSKTVLFRLEKAAPGMAKKLVKTLKLASFKKVVIESADGTPPEVGDDDEGAQPPPPAQAGAPQTPAPQPTAADLQDVVVSPAASEPEPPAPPPPPTPTAAPSQTAAPAAPAAPAAAPPAATAAFAKTRDTSVKVSSAWIKMANNVHGEFDKLQATFVAAFKGNDMAADLEGAFKKRVDRIRQFDRDLAGSLVAVSKAKDPDEQASLVGAAKQTLQRYQSFIDSDTTLSELDDNPFVPNLGIKDTVSNFLSVISTALG